MEGTAAWEAAHTLSVHVHYMACPGGATGAASGSRGGPYGKLWLDSYSELAQLYDLTVIGVSNVGRLTAGPWEGRKVIGCSLAVGPGGEVLARGPTASTPRSGRRGGRARPSIGRGTQIADALEAGLSRAMRKPGKVCPLE